MANSTSATGEHKSADLRAPKDDEIEVTIIGQGVGESILIHTGDGNWLIVDTFEISGFPDDAGPAPAPIQYLRDIGVDPRESVEGICITHPHSDHYGGIRTVIEESEARDGSLPCLYWPKVLHPHVWTKLEKAIAPASRAELYDVYCAAEDRDLVELVDYGSRLHPPFNSVMALSPLPKAASATYTGRRKNFYENLSSIAMWLKIEQLEALLGADLDDHDEYGWRRIKDKFNRNAGIPDKDRGFGFVKVPHHGSLTAGRAPGVAAIRHFAGPKPVAVFTRHSSSKLPNPKVVARYGQWADTVILGNTAGGDCPLGWTTFRGNPNSGWQQLTFGAINMPALSPADLAAAT